MKIVLIHGGAHGAWCWERMIPYLEAPALAIDLPGRGEKPADLSRIVLQDWVDAVVQELTSLEDEKVMLVGHSLAGITMPRVAERIPERIAGIVFISCSVPPEGRSVLDILSPDVRPLAEAGLENDTPQLLPTDIAAAMFCSDMNEEQTRFVTDRLVPEAWSPLLEPSRLQGLRLGIPMTWIKLTADPVVTPLMQDEMIARLGDIEVLELDSGHDAMISRPHELAALISGVTRSP